MSEADGKELIGGYATDSLTRSEKDRLFSAALGDQALFDQLMEEEDVRVALSDESFKALLIDKLRRAPQEETGIAAMAARVRRFLGAPIWIPVAALASVTGVFLLVQNGVMQRSSPIAQIALGPSSEGTIEMSRLIAPGDTTKSLNLSPGMETRPPVSREGAKILMDRVGDAVSYRIGDQQRLGMRIERAATVLLFLELPDGSSIRLFPNRLQSSADVEAGRDVILPPPGQGNFAVEGPAGKRKLILILLPAGTNVAEANLDDFRGATRIEKVFEVTQ